jgi:hypothetical protein
MQLNHTGTYIFKGGMGSIAELGVTATADSTSSKKSYKNG